MSLEKIKQLDVKQKNFLIGIIIFAVLIIGSVGAYQAGWIRFKKTVYIAVVVPDKNSVDGIDAIRGADLYINEVNQSGDFPYITFETTVFEDEGDDVKAVEVAEEIVAANKFIAVIGHAQSGPSTEAGKVYMAAEIPAITGSAASSGVTLNNPWYFRLIQTSESQSRFLANYIFNTLGNDRASIFHDTDTFGQSLADPFIEEFQGLGGTLVYDIPYDPDDPVKDLDTYFREFIETLKEQPEGHPGIIYIAGRAGDGANLIVMMKDAGLEDLVKVGASSFTNADFITTFKNERLEQAFPGYYSNDVRVIAPIVFDVAGELGQDFRFNFKRAYEGEPPGMKAATNYDAAFMIVKAIETFQLTGNLNVLAEERENIRQYWASLQNIQNAVEGVTGLIFFNENGDIVKPVTIGKYDNQILISEFIQLSPVPNIQNFAQSELDELIANKEMVFLGDQYMRVTNVVYTGIDINEISNLNIKDATYTVDFYLWFRYRGDLDVDNITFTNAAGELALGDPIAEESIANENEVYNYKAYRVKGEFTSDFNFKAYPFDTQEIWVRFRHKEKHREELTYVVDDIGLQRPAEEKELLQRFEDNHVMDITGWTISNASFFQDIVVSDSTLGNPKFFNTPFEIESSRFNTGITVSRDIVSFSIKNLLPLFIMILFSYLIFFFPASEFSTINGIIRGVLLTVAFFHLKLSSDLPGIDYIVALDYVFYILYFLFVAELIFTLLIKIRGDDEVFIQRLFITGRIAFPLVIVVSLVILFLANQGV